MIKNLLYDFLQTIPKWKVVSYKFLAEKFWTHPRTIARILAQNIDQDKYPCYKVVCSDGKISWYNLWVEQKISKLEKDWIIINNWKIDKKYFL